MESVLKFDGDQRESRTETIARRLRGALGERRLSQAELGRMIHMNKASVSRRLAGEHPWRIDELELVCRALHLDLDELLIGTRNPRPGDPNGGAVRHQGLEPRTRWSIDNRGVTSNVVDGNFTRAAHPDHDVDLDSAAAA